MLDAPWLHVLGYAETEQTHPVGAVQHLVVGVVHSLVRFQLSLTQRDQVIFNLLVDSAI